MSSTATTDNDDEMSRCEQLGHIDERIRDEDETGATYECLACGAEWWDEYGSNPQR